jgi:hypothetical protein
MFFVKIFSIIIVTTSVIFSAPQMPGFFPFGPGISFNYNSRRTFNNDPFDNNPFNNNPLPLRSSPNSNDYYQENFKSSSSSCSSYFTVQNSGMGSWGQLSISEPFQYNLVVRITLSTVGSISNVSASRSFILKIVKSMLTKIFSNFVFYLKLFQKGI